MVGIGGGAPLAEQDEKKKQDIRLGDVVVSTPGNGKGGVCQYDYGKAIQGQGFILTGHLNSPPQSLLAATTLLETDFYLQEHEIEGDVSALLASHPKVRKRYQRPDPATDRLYKSSFVHLDDTQSCSVVCDRKEEIVERAARGEDEEEVMVHYGLIASADTLMKNALLRNIFARNLGILCFEMEAAGLMNQFPFLVIRGICDYSDSHKNKEWQGYAAMTAAAYARRLLLRLLPGKVSAEAKLSELEEVRQAVQDVSGDLKQVHQLVEDHHQSAMQHNIQKWLSAADPKTDHCKALGVRHQGSGSWVLRSGIFEQSPRIEPLLWLHGSSGCGKPVLASTIIEHLQQTALEDHVVLYFYFDFQDTQKQTFDSMLRSLIRQMYQGDHRQPLHGLFTACSNGNDKPDGIQLRQCLKLMLEGAGQVKVVLDALDECTTRDDVFAWIKEIRASGLDNLQLIITSQPEFDIRKAMEHQISEPAIIAIQDRLVHEDINTYVKYRIRSDEKCFGRWRNHPDVLEKIERSLMMKATGMFRWAACQLDALGDCLDLPMLEAALDSLPQDLDDTYTRILQRVPHSIMPKTTRILQLLAFSDRPLQCREVIDALAVSLEGKPTFDCRWRMPDVSELAMVTSSLVTYTTVFTEEVFRLSINRPTKTKVQALQLAHLSVKEYLLSPEVEERFKDDILAYECFVHILYEKLKYKEDLDPFFYVARKGLHIVVKILLDEDENVNAKGEYYGNVLSAAAARGHDTVVQLLLKAGVDVNAQGGYHGNALYAASHSGHDTVIQLLLDAGADIYAQGGEYGNALCAASDSGHEKIVQLLVNAGADINIQGESGSALYTASARGCDKVVQILLPLMFPEIQDRPKAELLLVSTLLPKDLAGCAAIFADLDPTQQVSRLRAIGLPMFEQFNGKLARYWGKGGWQYLKLSELSRPTSKLPETFSHASDVSSRTEESMVPISSGQTSQQI